MERLTLTWTRPDGEKAVAVEFTYETPDEASDVLAELLARLATARQTRGGTHEPAHTGTVESRRGI